MKTKIETIGKERALHYLQLNKNNRPVSTKRVAQYLADIEAGKWKSDTGEAIKISKKGFLIDGQHRLHAISKSTKEIPMLVVYDLDENIFDVLDSGKSRGASDVFALSGIADYTHVVSMLREYNSMKSGKYYAAAAQDEFTNTNAALLEKYKTRPDYYSEVSRHAGRLTKKFNNVVPRSNISSLLLLFNDIDPIKADIFFNDLCGINSSGKSCMESLKGFLIRDKIAAKKVSQKLRIAYIIKTWNAYRLNKDFKNLRFDEKIEAFPIAI